MERILIFLTVFVGVIAAGCRHGDNPNFRINRRYCDQLTYSDRHLCYISGVSDQCCRSCERLRIPGARYGCPWGDKMTGCKSLSSRQCQTPHYNEVCCQTCGGTQKYCRDDPNITINGYRCSEFIRYKGLHNCYQGSVINACCESCESRKTTDESCKFGDKKQRQFTDGASNVIYRCENLRGGFLHKCSQAMVKADCCQTCRGYEVRSKRDVADDKSEIRRDTYNIRKEI